MSDELFLCLCGLSAFLLPLLVQLSLCSLARGTVARQAGLLFPAGWLLAALAVLSVDESHSFIRLGPYIAGLLLTGGLLALAGYGLAWLAYHIHRKRR